MKSLPLLILVSLVLPVSVFAWPTPPEAQPLPKPPQITHYLDGSVKTLERFRSDVERYRKNVAEELRLEAENFRNEVEEDHKRVRDDYDDGDISKGQYSNLMVGYSRCIAGYENCVHAYQKCLHWYEEAIHVYHEKAGEFEDR